MRGVRAVGPNNNNNINNNNFFSLFLVFNPGDLYYLGYLKIIIIIIHIYYWLPTHAAITISQTTNKLPCRTAQNNTTQL